MKRNDLGLYLGTILLVAFVLIAILTLLGPAIGNSFSNIVANLPTSNEFPSSQSNTPRRATPVSAANWDDEMVALRPADRMIIKDGELSLLVKDTHAAIDRTMQIAARYGGYVQSSTISGEGTQAEAD